MKKFTPKAILISLLLSTFVLVASADTVTESSTVTAEMTMQLQDGTVVATTKDKEPVTFKVGDNKMLASIQSGIQGMAPGESKKLVLKPDQAFGEGNPEAVQKVPNDNVPDDLRKVGQSISMKGQDGKPLQGRVIQVGENNTVLDFNHPLAGQTIVVDVKVLEVR